MEKFGSGIRDGKKLRSGIRDKHPGSATLLWSLSYDTFHVSVLRNRIKKTSVPIILLFKSFFICYATVCEVDRTKSFRYAKIWRVLDLDTCFSWMLFRIRAQEKRSFFLFKIKYLSYALWKTSLGQPAREIRFLSLFGFLGSGSIIPMHGGSRARTRNTWKELSGTVSERTVWYLAPMLYTGGAFFM